MFEHAAVRDQHGRIVARRSKSFEQRKIAGRAVLRDVPDAICVEADTLLT